MRAPSQPHFLPHGDGGELRPLHLFSEMLEAMKKWEAFLQTLVAKPTVRQYHLAAQNFPLSGVSTEDVFSCATNGSLLVILSEILGPNDWPPP